MKIVLDEPSINRYLNQHQLKEIIGKTMLSSVQLHYFDQDEIILSAGDAIEYYYIIVDGKTSVSYLLENGKAVLLKFYNAPIPLGDIEVFKNIPICCEVKAVKDTVLIAIPAEVVRRHYMEHPIFMKHLIDGLSDKLFATLNNSSYNLTFPLINRFSSYLVEFLTEESFITLESSFNDISQFLGSSYRHLNRTIKELEACGVIKQDNKTIHILNKKQLIVLSKNLYVQSL